MRAIIGHSDEVLTSDAVEDVIRQCTDELGGEVPKAALLFTSVDYDHGLLLSKIADVWPGLPLIGSSSDGEVSSKDGFRMDSVLLTLLCGEGFEAYAGVGRDLSGDVAGAVAAATDVLDRHGAPKVAFTSFAPSTSACDVLRRLEARIDDVSCPVLGGLSGDHCEFSRMVEFCGTEVLRDSFPVLFLYGDVRAGWGIGSGWFPIGDIHRVTGSAGHLVHTISGRPAVDLYTDYYGSVPQDTLGKYPLAVYEDGPEGLWTLRSVMGTDEETGAMRFAGDVPEGSLVRMTEVLPEGILSGTSSSIRQAFESYPGDKPELALLFSCAARKWVLGTQVAKEADLFREACPEGLRDLKLSGLYVYGEIAPPERGQSAAFHNETCITVLLGSDEGRQPRR